MKVLTPVEMREVDRRTIERGIPGIVLMENAGHRVVEFLEQRFAPLAHRRIVVFCGKGNNGGDGLVVARQILTRFAAASLHVVFPADPATLRGDAATAFRMFEACGGVWTATVPPVAHSADIVIDAIFGTGFQGHAEEPYASLIADINEGFPGAKIVAVDVPSGALRADYTVTFVAPKVDQVLSPTYEQSGELVVGNIGTPPHLLDDIKLNLSEGRDFAKLFKPRAPDSNKGMYGHVLVIGGTSGKTGAASMAGLAALRAGAGLVTVASAPATLAPELMVVDLDHAESALAGKSVVAIGPGIGNAPEMVDLVRRMFQDLEKVMVIDADGLNALAGSDFKGGNHPRILTPHPGEMGRLCGISTKEVQQDRIGISRKLAAERNVIVLLKGDRSLIAFPDGRVWINPTGSPALATAGTGDILTGLIAGLCGQHESDLDLAIRAAVWLHGRSGELGAQQLGEQCFIATDILRYLPEAMRECRNV